jgi:hypothetical protein
MIELIFVINILLIIEFTSMASMGAKNDTLFDKEIVDSSFKYLVKKRAGEENSKLKN